MYPNHMLKEPSGLVSNPSYTGATACPDQWRSWTLCGQASAVKNKNAMSWRTMTHRNSILNTVPIQWVRESEPRSKCSSASKQQADDEQHDEDEEQDLGDADGRRCDSAKSENRREDRDYQEYPCVPKHVLPPVILGSKRDSTATQLGFAQSSAGRAYRDVQSLLTLRRRGRWNATFRSLLESEGDLNEPRLAASRSGKRHAERRRLGIESGRKLAALLRPVGDHPERHHDDRIPGASGQIGPTRARRQDGVQPVSFDRRVDSVGPAQQIIFANVGVVAGAIGFQIHFIRNIQARLPEANGAALHVRQVPFPKLGQRFHRSRRAQRLQPRVEIPLHAVLEVD